MSAEAQIRAKLQMVLANEANFGVLSTGERIAVAMVLNRFDLVSKYGSILEAIDRLNQEWTQAALHIQRYGFEENPHL
jgi:hypothetical protein